MHYNNEVPLQEAEHFFCRQSDAEHCLLDIGCGFGGTMRYFAKKQHFAKIVGIDIQQDMVYLASKLLLDDYMGLQHKYIFVCADISETSPEKIMDWAGQCFSTVISLNVFIHLDKRQLIRTFGLIDQVLLSGGKIYIEDFFLLSILEKSEQEILQKMIGCPYLPTRNEYLQIVREANSNWRVEINDISDSYTHFAKKRFVDSLSCSDVDLTERKFYKVMDDLLSSRTIGGLRLKIEK